MAKYVYDFSEGNKDMKDLLGGKGANLAEMTNMGLPVPPGFTVSTQACLATLASGDFPEGLMDEVEGHLQTLESSMGKRLGDADDPLLVSVRSGAKFSMPGMMDTVLNLGAGEHSLQGLEKQSNGDRRFAWDACRRFVQMFGKIVMDVPGEEFEHALDRAKQAKGEGAKDTDLDADDLQALYAEFLEIYKRHTGSDFPTEPRDQLRLSIEAVFKSWNGKRARDYRRQNKISDDLGTAVNVQAMVFGNRGMDSGTGVAFTRDPSTGEKLPYGDYLENAQGEDVVAGIRNTKRVQELEELDATSYRQLIGVMDTLEGHYRDMCDIEFTIEKGRLWILQTRIGKRTALAEWVMAYDMLEEGLIDEDTALLRVDANRLEELFKRRVKTDGTSPIAKGLNASPGAATGMVVFSADDAEERAKDGAKVILVRRETTPDDYHGMIASQGILTSAGGTNSHAAVVARGEGIPAVCGADAIRIDLGSRSFSANGTTVKEGEVVTIDGFTGAVFVGELPLEESALEKARAGDAAAREEKIWKAFERLMSHADARRRLRVRANADTPDQSTNARERGAEGIGLCRTEHMFLGQERVAAVQQMIFAETAEEEDAAYQILLPLQRNDFVGIFRAMDGLPVTVRLLDPPLHEFLPNQVDLAVGVARAEERGRARGRPAGRADPARPGEDRPAQGGGAPRGQPHAGAARRAPGDREAGAVRDAGPRDLRGRGAGQEGGPRPAGRDHDPARGDEGRARADAGRARARGARRARARGRRPRPPRVGDDDRAAAGGRDRRRHRPVRRLLLVRDQRPDADGVRLLAGRHRQVRRHVRGAQARAGEPVRHRRPPRRRAAHADRLRGGQGREPAPAPRDLRRARGRPGERRVLPRGRARLRELLAVPRRDRSPRRGTGRRRHRGVRLEVADRLSGIPRAPGASRPSG